MNRSLNQLFHHFLDPFGIDIAFGKDQIQIISFLLNSYLGSRMRKPLLDLMKPCPGWPFVTSLCCHLRRYSIEICLYVLPIGKPSFGIAHALRQAIDGRCERVSSVDYGWLMIFLFEVFKSYRPLGASFIHPFF